MYGCTRRCRTELDAGYQACLRQLTEQGPDGGGRASEWRKTMGRRILEADKEMLERRKRVGQRA